MTTTRLTLLAAGLLATPAIAVNTWTFEVDYSDPAGTINSLDDTARITLWASFDPNQYAFCAGALNLAADDTLHAGVWSYIERILDGPGTQDGTAIDGTVYDIRVGQLHFPGEFFADTSNPIRAWTAVWQTENLHPRTIPLSTATSKYDLYTNADGTAKSFLDTLIEGNGMINVVPSPSTVPLLSLSLLIARRRRPRAAAGIASLLALTGHASAKNTWLFEVDYSDPAGVINSPDDTARVTLWASFDPQWFAFGAGNLDLVAADPRHAGAWSDLEVLLAGPGTHEGTAVEGTVHDILVGQIYFPPEFNADTSNPIKVWSAVWTTQDVHSRTIPVSTLTAEYYIYTNVDGTGKSFIDSVVEGNGAITVVPSSPGAVVLTLGVLGRRRRR